MEYKDLVDRIDKLLGEADEIEKVARTIQATRPSTFNQQKVRTFRNRYQTWYASALLTLPDDVKIQFSKEFDGGRFTHGIGNFISDPTRPNAIFAQAAQESPDALSTLYWQYPMETAFGQRFAKQQALLRQARERYVLQSTNPDQPVPGLLGDPVAQALATPAAHSNAAKDSDSHTHALGKGVAFIAHGRSPLYLEVFHYIKDELKLEPVAFETEDHTSEQITEILNQYLDRATVAIIVMTGEIKTLENRLHARQNVVHEAGLFQAKLGFDRVALLKENGVESFSNVQGLVYIPFDPTDISGCFYRLRRFLVRHKLVTS